MKTCIYYFSGTGNSLAVAKQICEGLGDCDLVSIASLGGHEGAITPNAERVGLVCPVYDFGLPAIVADFARRLNPRDTRYLFAVITFGGLGASALTQLDGILNEQGRSLDAAWAVAMPGNFPPPAHRGGYGETTGMRTEYSLPRIFPLQNGAGAALNIRRDKPHHPENPLFGLFFRGTQK